MRRWVWAAFAALSLAVALTVPAGAEYQGTDPFADTAPQGRLSHGDQLDIYPSSSWGLDSYISVDNKFGLGGVSVDMKSMIAQAMSSFTDTFFWQPTKAISGFVISLFDWSMSLDLVHGRGGLLRPMTDVMKSVSSLTDEFLGLAVLMMGFWLMWNMLVRRRVGRSVGQLVASFALVVLAAWIVAQPQQSVGQLSTWSNDVSEAALALSRGDSPTTREQAKRDYSSKLFRVFVHDPWTALEFGGQKICVDRKDHPVPLDSGRCQRKIDASDKYAERWLYFGPPGSKRRGEEYKAVAAGKGSAPTWRGGDDDPGRFPQGDAEDASVEATPPGVGPRGYTLTRADRPAVDMMQEAAVPIRLAQAAVILLVAMGGWLVVGTLAVYIIVWQVMGLLLLVFAPVALLCAVVPGKGHALFRRWLMWLVGAFVAKVLYSLILAVVLAMVAALSAATGSIGWLAAFGLQGVVWWLLWFKRNTVRAKLSQAFAGAPAVEMRVTQRAREMGSTASDWGKGAAKRKTQNALDWADAKRGAA